MSILNLLREELESQKIYDGLKGKYETRFDVDGDTYAFIAEAIGGVEGDNNSWFLHFENINSQRLVDTENNDKVSKSFVEAVSDWVKKATPFSIFTYGSSLDVYTKIIEGLKKNIKGYNLIDETLEGKDAAGNVINSNPVGRVRWQKMEEKVLPDGYENAKLDDNKKTFDVYEEPKDVKPPVEFTKGSDAKSEKLDKSKSYVEGFKTFKDNYLKEKK